MDHDVIQIYMLFFYISNNECNLKNTSKQHENNARMTF